MAALLREQAMKVRESQPKIEVSDSQIEAFVDEAYKHAQEAANAGAFNLHIGKQLFSKEGSSCSYCDAKGISHGYQFDLPLLDGSSLDRVQKVAKEKYQLKVDFGLSTWHVSW